MDPIPMDEIEARGKPSVIPQAPKTELQRMQEVERRTRTRPAAGTIVQPRPSGVPKGQAGYMNAGLIDEAGKGLVKGRIGGLANTALGGASRETGVKLGKGDYVGAATEFGKEYAIGAAADVGIRKAGQAVMQRMPGLAARVAGGTAASGGWAAPILGAYAVYDLADGLVEGTTGKGIRQREEEAADAAVTRAYERKWNQPAPKGGFVPKDKPLPAPKVERKPVTLSNINNAVEAVKGLAPEATVRPATIEQGTPQIEKPDTGNFLQQWTNKVRSWFK